MSTPLPCGAMTRRSAANPHDRERRMRSTPLQEPPPRFRARSVREAEVAHRALADGGDCFLGGVGDEPPSHVIAVDGARRLKDAAHVVDEGCPEALADQDEGEVSYLAG